MTRILSLIACLITLGAATTALAATCTIEDPGWQSAAKAGLTKNGAPLTDASLKTHAYKRCIKMKNYVCMMHATISDPWNGSDGRHDCALKTNGHAVFSDPKYSIRSMVRDLCSKHRRGVKSALAVLEARTPWCDTNGSKAVRKGHARTCQGGDRLTDAQIAARKLIRCERPANGQRPSAAYCAACNCPDLDKAKRLIGGLQPFGITEIDQDLGLFTEAGALRRDRAARYISNIVYDEVGALRPTPALLTAGFDIAGTCRPKP